MGRTAGRINAWPEDRRPADPLGARVAQERSDPDSPQLRLFAVAWQRVA